MKRESFVKLKKTFAFFFICIFLFPITANRRLTQRREYAFYKVELIVTLVLCNYNII